MNLNGGSLPLGSANLVVQEGQETLRSESILTSPSAKPPGFSNGAGGTCRAISGSSSIAIGGGSKSVPEKTSLLEFLLDLDLT